MNRAITCGTLSAFALVLSALGQVRVVPQCHTWQTPEPMAHEENFVPVVMVWTEAQHAEWPGNGYKCMTTGALAAEHVAYTLRDATWLNEDGSNAMIIIPHFGHEYANPGITAMCQ